MALGGTLLQIMSLGGPLLLVLVASQTTAKTLGHDHVSNYRLPRNQPEQLKFTEVSGLWDDKNTFFTPNLVRANINGNLTGCPWRYVVDHNFNRYPQYIYRAECDRSNMNKCHGVLGTSRCTCTEVEYSIPILERRSCDSSSGEQHWVISGMTFSGACVPRFN